MPRVSVLIPVHNGERFLGEAVESVLSQEDAPPYEVVLVNDGSTDGTGELVRRFQKDARVKAVQIPHGGIAAALTAGLAHCSAEYICRLDADDRMVSGRLAAQTAFLDENPGVHLVSGLVTHEASAAVPSDGMRRYVDWMNSLRTHEEMFQAIWTDSPVAHPSVMIRRSAMEAAGGYREVPWPEDTDLWFRLFLSGFRFTKIPAGTVVWRDHENRLTRTDDGHYGPGAQAAMKAHYLPRFFRRARHYGVTVLGAGPFGKRLAKALAGSGVTVNRFIDVDSRKVGSTRLGIPVGSPESLSPESPDLLVAAVGSPGARPVILKELATRGFPPPETVWNPEETRIVFCH